MLGVCLGETTLKARVCALLILLIASAIGLGQAVSGSQGKGPESDAYGPGQNVADILREVAGADGAFIAAAMLDPKKHQADDLSKLLVYPTDGVVIVSLTGSQVRQAFERSLSLYPQPYWGFLQISGFEVVFNPEGAANQRVKSITASGQRLDDLKNYQVAMPIGLARGGYGYFKIWNEQKIVSTVADMTVEKAAAGKKAADTKPRWVAQSSSF